jgi:polysaccharide biosynthesis/export protein
MGVPIRNILIIPEQMQLTRENSLYNCNRVGGVSIFMTQKSQGVFRLLAQVSSGVMMFVLVATPATFSQQQKPPETPKNLAVDEANERIAQLALASTAKQGDYIIGSGDLLTIEVFDVPELSREVRVNQTGYVSLPLLPVKVQVSGLTSFQLQDKIAELLQANGLVSAPQVTVSLKEQHSQPITVTGAVRNPMEIQAIRQTTLLQALSQAGGIAGDAGNVVIVTRPIASSPGSQDADSTQNGGTERKDHETFTISLNDLIDSGDSRFDILVVGGDVISVPHAGIIYVVGAVNHPGGFVIQNDPDRMTALKMLSLAGGPTTSAKGKDAVILRKNLQTGKRDQMPIDLSKVLKLKSEDVALQPSDIIFVPDSNSKKAMRRTGDIAVGLASAVALFGVTRF